MCSALRGRGLGLVRVHQRTLVAATGEQGEGEKGEQERGEAGGFHGASIAMPEPTWRIPAKAKNRKMFRTYLKIA